MLHIKDSSPVCISLLLSTVAYSPWWCSTELLQIFGQLLLLLGEGIKTLHPLNFFRDDQFITVCPEMSMKSIMHDAVYSKSPLNVQKHHGSCVLK